MSHFVNSDTHMNESCSYAWVIEVDIRVFTAFLCCSVLQYVVVQCAAVCCSMLQCVAVCNAWVITNIIGVDISVVIAFIRWDTGLFWWNDISTSHVNIDTHTNESRCYTWMIGEKTSESLYRSFDRIPGSFNVMTYEWAMLIAAHTWMSHTVTHELLERRYQSRYSLHSMGYRALFKWDDLWMSHVNSDTHMNESHGVTHGLLESRHQSRYSLHLIGYRTLLMWWSMNESC